MIERESGKKGGEKSLGTAESGGACRGENTREGLGGVRISNRTTGRAVRECKAALVFGEHECSSDKKRAEIKGSERASGGSTPHWGQMKEERREGRKVQSVKTASKLTPLENKGKGHRGTG